MHYFLGVIGYLGIAIALIFFVVVFTTILKLAIKHNEKKTLATKITTGELDKKHYAVDLQKYKLLVTNVSLSITLLIVLAVFEVPELDKVTVADLPTLVDNVEEQIIEIPPTQQKLRPPPTIKHPQIIEIPDEEEIKEEIEVDLDIEIDEETAVAVEEIVETESEPEPEEEKADEVFQIVEESAEPAGGYTAFYKYVGENIKYPSQARTMRVEGRIYLQFIVERDGRLTDVKIIRGIGAGCDEEAKRVLETAPKWKPGKRRGRPVRQKIVLPVSFKLG